MLVLTFENQGEVKIMKKHIIGLALFSFIVSAAAVIFALFSVPEIPLVSVPQYVSTQRTHCKMRRETKDITFEVISTQLDLDSEVLTSEIRVRWNGNGKPPKKVTASIHLFTVEDDEEGLFDERQVFIEPFSNKNEATVLIKYKVMYDLRFDRNKNLYALFEFSQTEKFEGYVEGEEDLSKANPVLFVYGRNSVVKR